MGRHGRACYLGVALLFTSSVPGHAQSAPITFQYYYDDVDQLSKVVDSTGIVLDYVYDAVGNITQINRSTVGPGALTIFSVTPLTVTNGGTLLLRGRGFSVVLSGNVVTLNGLSLRVISATDSTLVVAVPGNATSGTLSITVGTTTTSAPASIAVLPVPTILSLSVKSALAGLPFTLTAAGANLGGTTFSLGPLLKLTSVTIDAAGTSAIMTVTPPASAQGYFTLVGTNAAGQSTNLQSLGFIRGSGAFNSFSIPGSNPSADPDLDGLTNAQEIAAGTDPLNLDTDGDGYPDGVEIVLSSDPLDPTSTPVIKHPNGYLVSSLVSVVNTTSPSPGGGFLHSFSGLLFSVLNSTQPNGGRLSTYQISGLPFSIVDLVSPTAPIGSSGQTVTGSLFSILNGMAKPFITSPVARSLRFKIPINPLFVAKALARMNGAGVCIDSDSDGICDSDEVIIGTNPFLADTDGDGYPDGLELHFGSDPLDSQNIPDIRITGYFTSVPISILNTIPSTNVGLRGQGASREKDVK